MEARDFRGQYSEFTARGAEIVGVSSDSKGRHASFANSMDLPFPLLSDPKSEIAKAYGVTRGGGWLPSRRVTFVIDRAGVVRQVVSAEVDVPLHARVALTTVKELADTSDSR